MLCPLQYAIGTSLILVALIVSGCARTDYVEIGDDGSNTVVPIRHVGFKTDPTLLDNFPNCTVILEPETAPGLQKFGPIVEEALIRHFPRKIKRIVDTAERLTLARQNSLDLHHKDDQVELSKISNCDTLLRTHVVGPGKTNLFVWSQVQIGIDVAMIRTRDDRILWRARHLADRSEGGIPFSPVGFVMDTYSSMKFSADREIADSVIDDAVRRIVRSIH